MAEQKLVDSVILTLIARLAIVAATCVGLPAAFWMMNRAANSVDGISVKIDTLREQAIETNGSVKLMQQLQTSLARTVDDHESRLRAAESLARNATRNN